MHPRVDTLRTAFERIHRDRMAGLPVVNARLCVATIGFLCLPSEGAQALQGVLCTPWFMSLVHLPAVRHGLTDAVGRAARRSFGSRHLDCLMAYEEDVGRYESCALFSPMHEFHNQTHAEQVAEAVLRSLWPAPAGAPERAPGGAAVVPSRRLFLLGRSVA